MLLPSRITFKRNMYVAAGILIIAFTDAQDLSSTQRDSSTAQPQLAFAFSGGGLLFPYYVGVAYQLRELGLLRNSTQIGGVSAGALVSVLIACGFEESEVREIMILLLKDFQDFKLPSTILRPQLEAILPHDAAERAQRHRLTIAYLEVFPRFGPRMVTSWESKEDLIETVLASCNFPFWFNQWPLIKCRGGWAVDGGFSVEAGRLGCPPLPGREIAVVALPLKIAKTIFNASDLIQPGQQGMQLPDDMVSTWPIWFILPPPVEKVDPMIRVGRAHARAFAAEQHRSPILEPRYTSAADMLTRDRLSPQKAWNSRPRPLWRRWTLSPRPFRTVSLLHALPLWTQARLPRIPCLLVKSYVGCFGTLPAALIGVMVGIHVTFAALRFRRGAAHGTPLVVE